MKTQKNADCTMLSKKMNKQLNIQRDPNYLKEQ